MNAVADKALVVRKDGNQEVASIKNHVLLLENRVLKSFLAGRRSAKRFRREVSALARLGGQEGFPELLKLGSAPTSVHMSRLPGVALARAGKVPDSVFLSLRARIETMLSLGVARHSLPARDVIVHPDGSAGIIDFERSRCSDNAWSPTWRASRAVTRFQLLRLIQDHAPHLLSAREHKQLRLQHRLRAIYRVHLNLRKRYKHWRGGVH